MRKNLMQQLSMFLFVVLSLLPVQAQDGSSTPTSPVQMTVTVRVFGKNKRMPDVNREDIIVRQGKDRLQVTGWSRINHDRNPLDLFIVIDDAVRTSVGSQFGDLREFIYSLPRTTSVGVGYLRNGTVQVAQDLTSDRRRAANALRIPIGSPGAYGSPYLSVIDLMKRWPESSNRREIVMITDGIDRLHGWPHRRGLGAISPDVNAASAVAQRTGRSSTASIRGGLDGKGTISGRSRTARTPSRSSPMKRAASHFSWAFANLSASSHTWTACRVASTTVTDSNSTLCLARRPELANRRTASRVRYR